MSPITICFINQKGGCGKSSSCFHLAGTLARKNHRVVVIDMDPQGSLSQGYFGSSMIENLPPRETVAAVFDDETVFQLPDLLIPTAVANIMVLRANQHLAKHNIPAPEQTGLKQFLLRSVMDELAAFDFILIDCPPNLYLCSWNALLASDFVIIPVPPEDFATQGLRTVHQAIKHAKALNPRLRLLGQLVIRLDSRLLIHRSYEKKLREVYGDDVLATVIPELSAYKVALACRQPVAFHSPGSRAAFLMDMLADEIIERTVIETVNQKIA